MRLLWISINLTYSHAWNTVVMSGMVLLVATWNCQISYKNKYARMLALPLVLLLNHHWNVASLSLFYRYYFGKCSSELAELVPLPFSRSWCTRYSDRLHDFPVTIHRCYKVMSTVLCQHVCVNSFFPRTARLWNSLPIEWFSLTYNLIGFRSRINRHLLTAVSFQTDFQYALTFLCFFF